MYRRPGVVYGFHGCDRSIAEQILTSHTRHLEPSKNSYDWLGSGVYFWESSPERAMAFALQAQKNQKITQGKIKTPYVVGAVIELGNCLNLLDTDGLDEIHSAYKMLEIAFTQAGKPLPVNKAQDGSGAYMVRELDCAVIELLHKYKELVDEKPFDTVISALWEGDPLYPGAGVNNKNHIQVCVRNPQAIRGYFRVREINNADLDAWDAYPPKRPGPRWLR